jgi:hypothetical protein
MFSVRFLTRRRVFWFSNRPPESFMHFVPRKSLILRFVRIFLAVIFLLVVGLRLTEAKPQSADSSTATIPILVSDFELFSVPPLKARPPVTPKPPTPPAQATNPKKVNTSPEPEEIEPPSVQARRLMDFFTATLLETLNKNGYNARPARGQNSPKGALLRGVFAEPDEKNRIRRALLGGTSVNPKFLLYVGIFNLARPDQPLYQLAAEQPGGSQFGPVITLNNYIPLAKYELDKNPTDEDVRRICAQIAASLTALLAANPSAFSQ